MFKLIKYELKGYYNELIGALIIIGILNFLLFINPKDWTENSVLGSSFLIAFAACVIVLIWNIRLYNRDLYGDTGYLMFTLPERGCSILGSKLIASFIQMLVVGGVSAIFFVIQVNRYNKIQWESEARFSTMFIVFVVLSVIFSYLSFLLLIYFSSTVCRVAIRNRKIGKLGGFIIFIVMSFLIGKITEVLYTTFPQCYSIKIVENINSINSKGWGGNVIVTSNNVSMIDYVNNVLNVPISVTIFSILLFIGLFTSVSYMIERKIDL